jgi:lipopolysaccharide/colanic/teichoic acid biosynthesis glycosyltransferase
MTPFGRFLARSKLDELPQFWNVLVGEMSIVGPRPESTDFEDCYTPAFRSVLSYKPGIFGPSQIMFRDEASRYPSDADPTQYYRDVLFGQKAVNDMSYFPTRTVWSDLALLVRGVMAVVGAPVFSSALWLRVAANMQRSKFL